MSAVQIAFAAGAVNLLYGLFQRDAMCLAIAAGVAFALWRENRSHHQPRARR